MPGNLHRIRHLWPGDGPTLLVIGWDDDTRTIVDMAGVIARVKAFAPLAERELFHAAEVIDNGLGIAWPGGLDYAAASLRLLAEEQRAMTTEEFRAWQHDLELSNQEAADMLGSSLQTLKNYRSGRHIPKTVGAFCRSTLRDPAVFRAHFRPRKSGRPRKSA